MPNPWERDTIVGGNAGPIAGPAPVLGPFDAAEEERKRQAAARAEVKTQADLNRDALLNQLTQGQIAAQQQTLAETADKAAKMTGAKADARRELLSSLDAIDAVAIDAADNAGWFETGLTGSLTRNIPGSAAKDLAGKLSPIKARAAIQTLIDAKAAGATFGALNEQEFKAVGDKIANLDPDMSGQEFFTQLTEIKRFYLDALRGIDPEAAENYKTKRGIRFDENGRGYLTTVDGPDNRPVTNPLGFDSGPGFMQQAGRGLAQGVGNAINGAMALPELIANPIGQALYNATGYGDQRYDMSDTLRGSFGIPQGAPGINTSMQEGAIAALGGAGLARAAAGAFKGTTGNVLNTVGRTPLRDTAAGAGAGFGMETGGDLGEYLGGGTGRAVGSVAGGLFGGVGGYGAANRTAARWNAPPAPNSRLQAADDLGISLMPADVGGTATRMATGAVGSTLGNVPLVAGAQKSLQSAANAARGLADRMGGPADPQGAGQAARRGFAAFDDSSKARAESLYSRVSVAPDAPVVLSNTRAGLAEMTNRLRSNPKLAAIWRSDDRLAQTLDALVPEAQPVRGPDGQVAMQPVPGTGELSWADMSAFRSQIGEIIGRPGIASDGKAVADLRNLYRVLSHDMEATAAASGPRALTEWKRATAYERGRNKRLEDVFSVLFGKNDGRSDEKVFGQISTWAKDGTGGDFKRLARALRSLPKEEADTIRATWVHRAGRATRANQEGAESEVFSPKEFAKNWHGTDKRARALLFPDARHRADMEKMVEVLDGMKTADEYTNYSRTALGGWGIAHSVGVYAAPVLAALSAATQYGAGMLLASPKFARAIASTARLPADQAGRRVTHQLGVIAGQQGAIGAEAGAVLRAMNDNYIPRAAASTDESDRERERR